ncbi:MAG: NAD(P)-dependent oxidoreductase [Hominisplanchenecus sp.]|nr:NAD(P)-dependent oxidoreductase [Hominisplanchenecus sp.]
MKTGNGIITLCPDSFDQSAFEKMERAPLFINVGRGEAVDEAALVNALDKGLIRGAGLDVLESENPDLEKNPLRNRENVILTPHAAFYSQDSMRALQVISCMNLIYFLKGEYEAVQWLVNEKQLSFLHTKKP